MVEIEINKLRLLEQKERILDLNIKINDLTLELARESPKFNQLNLLTVELRKENVKFNLLIKQKKKENGDPS